MVLLSGRGGTFVAQEDFMNKVLELIDNVDNTQADILGLGKQLSDTHSITINPTT